MKYQHRLIGLLFLLCAACCGRTELVATDDGNVYTNASRGFSITFPRSWSVQEEEFVTVRGIAPPTPGFQFQENVSVSSDALPKGATLADQAATYAKAMEKSVDGGKVVRKTDTTLDGVPAKIVVSTNTAMNMLGMNITFLVAKNTRLYTIICTTLQDNYPRYALIFTKIAASFKMLAPPVPVRSTWAAQGFSLIPPLQWTTAEETWPNIANPVICFYAPKPPAVKELSEMMAISQETLPDNATLLPFVDRTTAALKTQLTDYKQLGSGDVTLNGRAAKWVAYTTTVQKTTLGQMRFLLVDHHRGYTILCSTRAELFNAAKDTFEKTVKSFDLIAEAPSPGVGQPTVK